MTPFDGLRVNFVQTTPFDGLRVNFVQTTEGGGRIVPRKQARLDPPTVADGRADFSLTRSLFTVKNPG
ncbi:MAG: hypothetical protein FJ399_17440, partial [Verrucomicrobia bacterium]|nr:hypothetical protein [Verrucomicrobiota bacterium]